MANSKISALTSATTPLAGTETLPIVQSSTTKQVSIANVTADRAVSTLSVASLGPNGIPITLQEITAAPSSATAAYVGVSTSAFPGGSNGDLILIPRTSSAADVRVFVGSGTPTEALVVQGSTKDIRASAGNYVPATAAKGVNFTANTPAAGMTSQLLNWYEEGTWTPTSFDISYSSASGSYIRIGSQVFVYFNIVLPATADANNITIVGFPFTVANLDQMRAGSIGYTDYGTACTPTAVKNTTRGNILTFAGAPVTNVSASTKTFSGVFIYRV